MSTISISLNTNATASDVYFTSILRSDTGLPPSGISLPLHLGNTSGNIWDGSFTDIDPPPSYAALIVVVVDSNPSAPTAYTITSGFPDTAAQAVSQRFNFVVPQNSQSEIIWPPFLDENGNAFDLSSATIALSAWTSEDGGATKIVLFEYAGPTNISVGGAGSNVVTVELQSSDLNLDPTSMSYSLVSSDEPYLLASGVLAVAAAVMS